MAAQGNEDPTWHLLLYVTILLGIAYLVWYFFRTEILELLRYVRLAELWLIGLFDSRASACFEWLKSAKAGDKVVPSPETVKAAAACYGASLTALPTVEALEYYNVSPSSIGAMTRLVSKHIRWITIIVCIAIGVYALYLTPRNKFRTRHDLESLIKAQSLIWPILSPIVNFVPSKVSARTPGDVVPDKLPVFAEALSPEEWISWHRIKIVNGIPDREMTRRAFVQQLGPKWGGLKGLPPYILALFSAFALKGVQKREESDDLLGRIARCWSPDKGLVLPVKLEMEIRKIAEDPEIGGEALKIASRHAYRTTAMLGVLKWARFSGGVLAPAHFLWLRGVDRNLWYPLNNLGRRAFHTEGAGAMAHFMAEEAAKKPLVIPRVDTAIVALNQYMAANARPIPPREEPGAIEAPRRTAALKFNGA